MGGRDDSFLYQGVFENRNALLLRISERGSRISDPEGITATNKTSAHNILVLLNRTEKVWVWSGVRRGVDEVLELVLSGFEVVKGVLEACDFLNDQSIGVPLLRSS